MKSQGYTERFVDEGLSSNTTPQRSHNVTRESFLVRRMKIFHSICVIRNNILQLNAYIYPSLWSLQLGGSDNQTKLEERKRTRLGELKFNMSTSMLKHLVDQGKVAKTDEAFQVINRAPMRDSLELRQQIFFEMYCRLLMIRQIGHADLLRS